MRMLIAIAFGCALVLGISNASSSASSPQLPAVEELTSPIAEDADTDVDADAAYTCRYSPLCQRASQCIAYCAGGIPVCFQGCCACAS